MKSIFFIKLLFILYLSISQSAIECIQTKRAKKIIQKTHQLRQHAQKSHKAYMQAKIALYLKIAAKFEQRDNEISQFKDVREQMFKMYQILQADGTKQEVVDLEVDNLKKLYDQKIKDAKDNKAQIDLIEKEMNQFFTNFEKARQIDEKYEKALIEQKQVEEDAKKIDSTLTKEQQDSQVEINKRKKFSLTDQILKGQQELMRSFTEFLNPKKDAKLFYKNTVKAIENSMPDKFCYKKASTLAPVQKLSCPATHPDSALGFCIETCDQGQARRNSQPDSKFEKILGVCWEQCNPAKKNKCIKSGLIVYPEGKSWTNWHWQRSFIPDFKTVFSKDVTCQPNEKKWGFLCYANWQECTNIGYEDCGAAACSLSSTECAKVIKDMVVSTILGLSKFALMFVAPGAAEVIKTVTAVIEYASKFADLIASMKESRSLLLDISKKKVLKDRLIKDTISTLKSNNQHSIDGVFLDDKTLFEKVSAILESQLVKVANNETKKSITDKLKETADKALQGAQVAIAVNDKLKENKAVVNQVVDVVKKEVGDKVVQGVKAVVTTQVVKQVEDVLEVVDSVVFDISLVQDIVEIAKSCSKPDNKIDCAKAILGSIAEFDPTGLVGIAKAFLYNTCKDVSDP